MNDFLSNYLHYVILAISTLLGLWGVALKFRTIVRQEILAIAPTKEHLERVESKLDTLVALLRVTPRYKKKVQNESRYPSLDS